MASEWVSVQARPPRLDCVVDVWLKAGFRFTNAARIYVDDAGGWLWHCMDDGPNHGMPFEAIGLVDSLDDVTHWMPLPAPPEPRS